MAGMVRDPSTGDERGLYYKDVGTIRIEAVGHESATARVLLSCQAILKGDLVIPGTPKPAVEYRGDLSNALTQIPGQGLVTSILLGKDDARELAAGQFCFISLGGRDGIKPGDRLTVFRPVSSFNSMDMSVDGTGANASYSPMRNGCFYRYRLNAMLSDRSLPPTVLGDIIVVQAGDRVSAGKIINSLLGIHLGDLVVKR